MSSCCGEGVAPDVKINPDAPPDLDLQASTFGPKVSPAAPWDLNDDDACNFVEPFPEDFVREQRQTSAGASWSLTEGIDSTSIDGVTVTSATVSNTGSNTGSISLGIVQHSGNLSSNVSIARLWSKATLDTDIPADLLRGVGIDMVLGGFGNVFCSNVGAQSQYLKSAPVRQLRSFISHDWGSTRAGKFLALCIIHNGAAACVASFSIGLVLVVLQSDSLLGVLPYPPPRKITGTTGGWGCWCQCLCPLVFMYVFFFWQTLRARFGLETRKVFVDKICVDQVDAENKAKAILGLAGFLNNTDRLIICWTPRYFTRLWCVYEIASWLYLRKPLMQIQFMPLKLAYWIFVQWAAQALMCLSYTVGQYVGGVSRVVIVVTVIICSPLYCRILRQMINDLRTLPQQLEDFSLATANCFCCSVNHIMPGTGQELPCDRQVVCRTINSWFPGRRRHSASSVDSHSRRDITHFDKKIRELFGPFILKRLGPMQIRYEYCLIISQPYLWRMLDVTVCFGTWDVQAQVKSGKVLLYIVECFCLFPIILKLSFWWFCWIDRNVGIIRYTLLDVLFSALLFLPVLALYMSHHLFMNQWLNNRKWGYFYGHGVALVFTTILMFTDIARRDLGLCAARLGSKTPKPT